MFKRKRILAIIMTLTMVVGMLPGMAFADTVDPATAQGGG